MNQKRIMKTAMCVFALALLSTLLFAKPAVSSTPLQPIYILSDGSIDPASAPIERNGNTYTFTGDAFAPIIVQKDSIVIDGAGHTLQGPYNGTKTDLFIIGQGPDQGQNGTQVLWTIGIDAAWNGISNLVIKNLNVKNFSIGTYLWTSNNTLTGNAFTENIVAVLLSGSGNTITGNYIANNENGLFFGANQPGNLPLNTTISSNCFLNNIKQLSGCVCIDYNTTEEIHTWDNGREGNFWSDYNGTDANGDGIGDKPYMIDVLNQDRYPLMESPANPPTVALKIPVEIIISATALTIITVAAVIVLRKRKRVKSNS